MTADYLFAIGQGVMVLSRFPVMIEQFQVKASTIPLTTSSVRLIVLVLFAIAFFTLQLWLSAALAIISITQAIIIFGQRLAWGRGRRGLRKNAHPSV